MAQKHNIFHGQFVRGENSGLSPISSVADKYSEFIKGLEPGQTVEIFMEANSDTGTVPQLAKIHASIRELAKELGYSFEDMKLEVKRRAGLCIKREYDNEMFMLCKSFADCSKEELALTLEAIMQIGDVVGINFR